MTKFETIVAALKNEATVTVAGNRFAGSADAAKFIAKHEKDEFLGYRQTRIFEKGVKYVTRARFGN